MSAARSIRRNLIVQRWGTPQSTVGSLNEPRERSENGVTFNEKWVYRLPRHGSAGSRERVIYWLRYDFVASFLVQPDGLAAREELDALHAELATLHERAYAPPHDSSRCD